ncbi:MAG: SdpI family protein [Lachnospira sp.]|nr:SdpI family protein [Lachnospira sp.]
MWFYITMFICNLLIPFLMIVIGNIMYKHPPQNINGWIGYRTTRSMKNEDTWQFAHHCCGRIWFKAGFILIIPTMIAMMPFIHSNDDVIGLVSLIIEGIQLVVLFGTIAPVEAALKRKFEDGEGNV